jgi:hypothetical protein
MKLLYLAGLLVAALPTPSRPQALAAQDSLMVWGTVERLYPGSRVLVRSDDDRLYEVRARGARIQLTGGDAGRWDDLRVGQGVDVFGSLRSDKSVNASLIRITGLYDPRQRSNQDRFSEDRYPVDRSQDDRLIDVAGTVSSLDPTRESFRLRSSRGLRTVEAFDETRWALDSGRRADFRDLHVGDDVRVRGEERGGRIVADEVTLLGPPLGWSRSAGRDDDRLEGSQAVVVGTVRRPTYELDRRIRLRSTQGEDLTVDVDSGAPIYKYDDRISVHELEQGDRIRVVGTWEGPDRIRARRIAVEVSPPRRESTRGYRSDLPSAPMPMVRVVGTLVSYDADRNRMRLSTRNGDRIVIADGTPAYARDERISRRDFRQGDRIRAVGYWNGREILATRVELAY